VDDQERHPAVMRTIIAALRLADDPQAASVALAPVIVGSVPAGPPIWLVEALLLEAIARYMPATPQPPSAPSSGPRISPSPTACSSPPTSTRRLDCLSAMPGSAPRTPP
jgi:hypothetical protein